MKAVLISIQSQWCQLIACGRKSLEIRKTRPKLETPFRAYIYCTKGVPLIFADADGRIPDRHVNGKVIGEFTCDGIRSFGVPYPAYQSRMDKAILEQSCLTYYQLHRYAHHDCLFGWHISDLKIYVKPLELSAFTRLRKTKFGLEPVRLERAPQSWCYVEGL